MNGRTSILLAIILTAAITGCDDTLPTQGGSGQPSGPRIYYSSFATSSSSVNSISPDLRQKKTIFSPGALLSPPRFGRIAFWVKEPNNVYRIFTGKLDGSSVQQVDVSTSLSNAICAPVLSPNGLNVAYSAHGSKLYTAHIDGTRKITLSTNAAYETNPAYSPDGSRIAFYGDDDRLYVVPSGGGTPVAIADSSKDYGDGFSALSWSPSGDSIAFVGTNATGGTDIYLVDVAGGGRVNITNDAAEDGMPTWSPDGSQIAYISDGYLYLVKRDGTGKRNLTGNFSMPTNNAYPEWSADGKKLVYTTRTEDETGFLYYIDFDPPTADEYVRYHVASDVYRGFWVE